MEQNKERRDEQVLVLCGFVLHPAGGFAGGRRPTLGAASGLAGRFAAGSRGGLFAAVDPLVLERAVHRRWRRRCGRRCRIGTIPKPSRRSNSRQGADAPRDYLAFLKGWALCLDKQYDASAAALAGMEKEFPQSRWLRKARQARGLALARKGDFRAAELIFRGEAEFFLCRPSGGEMAGVYLEFADLYFQPLREEQSARLRQGPGVLPPGDWRPSWSPAGRSRSSCGWGPACRNWDRTSRRLPSTPCWRRTTRKARFPSRPTTAWASAA